MKEKIIAIDHLCHEYHTQQGSTVQAVKDISMQIHRGEFVCIIGHNGSGKSTLARHINALLQPTRGTVYVNEMNIADYENIWRIRQSAGMIFQNPDNQIVSAVVEDDVAFAAENIGIAPDEIRRRVDDALEQVGLTSHALKSPAYLSGGQKQRLAIAGILAMQPQIIILDEATAMLDPKGRTDVLRILKKINQERNITVVHITHYMEEAVEADRVFVVDRGQIILEGTPSKVFSEPETLRAAQLEVPEIVKVIHSLRSSGLTIPDDVLTVKGLVNILCQ